MKGTRFRTEDDKYWQITTKDGEIIQNQCPLRSRLMITTIWYF